MRLPLLFLLTMLCGRRATCQTNLMSTLQQFREALRNGNLVEASEIASKVDDEVHRRSQAALIKDAPERLPEVLSWLPANTESFFFLQTPFAVTSTPALTSALSQEPERRYAIDRLIAVDKGRFFKAMNGVTIQIVASGMSNRKPRFEENMTPALMPAADVAYFYFLDRAVTPGAFGVPDSVQSAHPIWKGTAQVLKALRGSETIREDSWLAFARPDLLVFASTRDLLLEILGRVSSAEGNRALPDALPEWKYVDRNASFWGLRHYRRSTEGNPEDPGATGVTMELDLTTYKLQTHYFSTTKTLPFNSRNLRPADFSVHPIPGGWLLESKLNGRGDYPFHIGMGLLGFGEYR